MRDILKTLVIKYQGRVTSVVNRNFKLLKWVEENSDKNCVTLRQKIYTSLYQTSILCPCGSGKLRQVKANFAGLAWCGTNGKCSCATEEISKKSMATCKERYGVENVFQNEQIKQRSRKTMLTKYGNISPVKVPILRAKINATMIKKFGVPWAMMANKVKHKSKNSHLKNWGSCYAQSHFTEKTLTILYNPELLKKEILANGFKQTAINLNCHISYLHRLDRDYVLGLSNINTSSYEKDISLFLQSYDINHMTSNKDILKGKELDIYIPSHKLAIEFDGLYWHSELKDKNNYYHKDKTIKCQENNIQLIHIFEDEWITKENICKSIIKGNLGLIINKIGARNCTIEEISSEKSKQFLTANHLQGYTAASINIALLYKNEIVQLMTFKRPRYNKNIQWELIRLATKIDTVIAGGINKIWSYFLNTYNPSSVVSYCDKRWFTGKIYEHLGFKLLVQGKPTYWYTDCKIRWHRSRFTKKKAVKAALLLSSDWNETELNILTEKNITEDILGLTRIWDCGQDTWIWNKI
jgi:hypothetical protein